MLYNKINNLKLQMDKPFSILVIRAMALLKKYDQDTCFNEQSFTSILSILSKHKGARSFFSEYSSTLPLLLIIHKKISKDLHSVGIAILINALSKLNFNWDFIVRWGWHQDLYRIINSNKEQDILSIKEIIMILRALYYMKYPYKTPSKEINLLISKLNDEIIKAMRIDKFDIIYICWCFKKGILTPDILKQSTIKIITDAYTKYILEIPQHFHKPTFPMQWKYNFINNNKKANQQQGFQQGIDKIDSIIDEALLSLGLTKLIKPKNY